MRRAPRAQSPRSGVSPSSAHFPVGLRLLPRPPGPNKIFQIVSERLKGARRGQKRLRTDAARRPLLKIGAELQKAERGGGEKPPMRVRATALPGPTHAARRGDARAARGRGGAGAGAGLRAPPAPSPSRLFLPLPPPQWAPSARGFLRRSASRRPGPARPAGRCPELPLPTPPSRPVAVWEAGVRPRAAECDGRGRGPPGAAASAAPRGPCIS